MMLSPFVLALAITAPASSESTPYAFETPFLIPVEEGWAGGYYSSPTFYDWDGDGLDDLFIGNQRDTCGGVLKIYRNVGKPGAPKFERLEDFKIAGALPRIPGG